MTTQPNYLLDGGLSANSASPLNLHSQALTNKKAPQSPSRLPEHKLNKTSGLNLQEVLGIINKQYDVKIVSPSEYDASLSSIQDEANDELFIIEDEIPFIIRNLGQQGI